MTITKCETDSEGNCTLASTVDQIAYGSTDDTYMDPNNTSHGYEYVTSCGAGCDSHYDKYASEYCTSDAKDKNSCRVKASEFAGVASCCSSVTPTSSGGVSTYSCKAAPHGTNWYPWSDNCVNSADGQKVIADYCAELAVDHCSLGDSDEPEKVCWPNLHAVKNCQQWCADNPVDCDNAMVDFCAQYPENEHCGCVLRENDQEYDEMVAAIGQACASCWYLPCTIGGSNLVPYSLTPQGGCECPDTVCTAVISVIDAGEVTIKDVDQTISCGNDPGPTPEGGGGISSLEWGLIIGGSVVLVTIIVVVAVLLGRKGK